MRGQGLAQKGQGQLILALRWPPLLLTGPEIGQNQALGKVFVGT